LNDKLIIFIETLEKKFNNKELMTTSWAMNTGMIKYKAAKDLAIIDWNFWNHSFSLTKASFQQSIEVICRSFLTYNHHNFIFKIVDF
jgi:hypothetical protein